MGISVPNATFNLFFFLGLGCPWVGEFVGFIIIFTCFRTHKFGISRTPFWDGDLMCPMCLTLYQGYTCPERRRSWNDYLICPMYGTFSLLYGRLPMRSRSCTGPSWANMCARAVSHPSNITHMDHAEYIYTQIYILSIYILYEGSICPERSRYWNWDLTGSMCRTVHQGYISPERSRSWMGIWSARCVEHYTKDLVCPEISRSWSGHLICPMCGTLCQGSCLPRKI